MRLATGIPTGGYPFAIAVVLSLSAPLVTGNGKEPSDPDQTGAPSLAAVSGDGQAGVVGSLLPEPLLVRATDSQGKTLRRKEVRFIVTSGGGSTLAGIVLTDARGYARDFWTLGTAAGEPQRLEARLVATGELLGAFTATARAGPVARIALLEGDGQTANPGQRVAVAPAVVLTDHYGNSVPGTVVTFAVALGGGTVTSATLNSDSTGVARIASWTLGLGGPNTLTATVTGSGVIGNPVTVTATAGSDFWRSGGSLPTSRVDGAATSIDGIVYAVGGETADGVVGTLEAFDPATTTWTPRSALPTARSGLAVGVVDGVLYAVGGWDGANIVGTVEAYDPATDSWTAKAPLPTPRTNLAIAVVNGVLYAIGGEGVVSPTSLVCYYPGYAPPPTMPWTAPCAIVEAYDPTTDTWTSKAPMSLPRVLLGAGVLNDRIYAVGGETPGHVSWHKTVEVYDPASDTWDKVAPMRTGRSGPGVGIVNGLLYAVGGEIPGAWTAALEAYDPTTNAWIRRAPMRTPRSVLGVAVVNGVLYAIGGDGALPADRVEAYQP